MQKGNSGRPKRKSRRNVDEIPLPATIKTFPPFILHNPYSWLSYVFEFLWPSPPIPHRRFSCVIVTHGRLSVIKVENVTDQIQLWKEGFFGKGVYSRSEASWYPRTARRLGLSEADHLPLTSEEVTAARREKRTVFKEQRAELERKKLDNLRRMEAGETVEPIFEDDTPKRPDTYINKSNIGEILKYTPTLEEKQLVDENGKLIKMEYVQLMPYEALFLSEFLNILDVSLEGSNGKFLHSWDLLKSICVGQTIPQFLARYAAYHYYRSKGWVARSGVKFATDYILYYRGPPYNHAEFAIIVVPVLPNGEEAEIKWYEQTRIGRVLGSAKKKLVYCYVEVPDMDYESYTIREVLEKCRVIDIMYRRWNATRNRD